MRVEQLVVIPGLHFGHRLQLLHLISVNLREIPATECFPHPLSQLGEEVPDVPVWVGQTSLTVTGEPPARAQDPAIAIIDSFLSPFSTTQQSPGSLLGITEEAPGPDIVHRYLHAGWDLLHRPQLHHLGAVLAAPPD